MCIWWWSNRYTSIYYKWISNDHYRYAINICCETNLDDFYECWKGTQPLKIIFSHLIDDNYVRRHGFDIYPDTELNRTYRIDKNNLYLDTNEIIMESEYGGNINIAKIIIKILIYYDLKE